MDDPFAKGPLVFRPRPGVRRANLFMVAFFSTFILVGWSLPILGGARGHGFFLFMALVCTVCFGGFLSMVVAALRQTRGPVELRPENVRAYGRELAWNEIAEAEDRTAPERMVVLRPKAGRPLVLRTTAYEDGLEMGRLALARVPRLPASVEGVQTYRPAALGVTLFVLATMLTMIAGVGLFEWGAPVPPGVRVSPAILHLGIVALLFLWMTIDALTRYVRLGPTELTVGTALGRRSITLALVDAVEATDAGLTVRAGGRKIAVSKRTRGFPQLRERLLALAPPDVPVLDGPTAATRAEIRDVLVFAPKPYAWLGSLVGGLGCLAIGLGPMPMAVQGMSRSPGAAVALMLMMSVPALLGIFGLWGAVEARTTIVLDEAGIERRALFGRKRMAWRAIDRAWRSGSTLECYCLRSGGESIDIPDAFLKSMPTLAATLDERLVDARAQAVERAEGEAFGPDAGTWVWFVGFLGLAGIGTIAAAVATALGGFLQARPGEEWGARMMGGLWLAGGLGLLYGAATIGARRYVPSAEGLEVRTLGGRRFLRWADVRRAESGVQDTGKRAHRRATLTLEHPEGSVRIDGMMIREFDRLRGYVLGRVDPAVVRDARGRSA